MLQMPACSLGLSSLFQSPLFIIFTLSITIKTSACRRGPLSLPLPLPPPLLVELRLHSLGVPFVRARRAEGTPNPRAGQTERATSALAGVHSDGPGAAPPFFPRLYSRFLNSARGKDKVLEAAARPGSMAARSLLPYSFQREIRHLCGVRPSSLLRLDLARRVN